MKKKIEKILYFWERLYPYVIAGLITWMLFKISFNPLQSNSYQEWIDGIVTLDSIIIGFEGTLIPIVFSMKYESGLVKYVLENDKKGLLRKYISATIAYVSAGKIEQKMSDTLIGSLSQFGGNENEILFVVYTERVKIEDNGSETDVTRIISARMATNFERGLYYGKNY